MTALECIVLGVIILIITFILFAHLIKFAVFLIIVTCIVLAIRKYLKPSKKK